MPNIIATREHKILAARKTQLTNNLLALRGGRPYINARLWRQPNESDRSWAGDAGTGVPGRRDRSYLVNDAGRISKKINDYLFSREIVRNSVDTEWAMDVTTTRLTVDQFFAEVSETFSAGQWCWLQADRGAPEIDPATGQPLPRSRAAKEASGDRIFWNLWNAAEVVDWSFDANGALLWLMTEEHRYDNTNPAAEPVETRVRTLWERKPTGVTYTRYVIAKGGEIESSQAGTVSSSGIPFIPLGVPSASPWWFDDVEMIQAAAMNMESLDCENLAKSVYPQLVVPASSVQEIAAKLQERFKTTDDSQVMGMVREIVRGLEYPFVEGPEDNGVTRYLTPNAQDLKILQDKTKALRDNLFDMAGLTMFAKESKQVASAESKQWDHLDVEATLGARARLLEEAEFKLIELSRELDPEFADYEPRWPHEFSIPNTEANVAVLTQLGNFIDLPASVEEYLRMTVVELLSQIHHIPEDVKDRMLDDIRAMTKATGIAVANPALDALKADLAEAEADGDEDLAEQLRAKIAAMQVD